ncbi:HAD-IA family hydrolase [Roseibium sp. RKSG952]|uniref:HAD-IA family hydrolase n=1 Tax=Roseibium sp. RKSG952 TaxID=2529384 RepID=UPI0012BC3AEB|nr:HAD-IA family hydrolase [Roseibium sp. RKSG952]MTH97382.1 HAD family hydrolase [Roseibium sp. RKSG952]
MYLVIFDCDGTLVDSQETILHGLEAGFAAAGLSMPDRRTALSIVGLSLERAFLELVGPQYADKVPLMASSYRSIKTASREAGIDFDPLYPGTREALEQLHARKDVLLGIATGKSRRGVDHILGTHGFDGWFATIQTADTSPSKPHPDMIDRALAETGAEASRTVMIGDTGFDMAMARAANAYALGVTWGYHDHSRLQTDGAHLVIDRFDELHGALETLLKFDKEPA